MMSRVDDRRYSSRNLKEGDKKSQKHADDMRMVPHEKFNAVFYLAQINEVMRVEVLPKPVSIEKKASSCKATMMNEKFIARA